MNRQLRILIGDIGDEFAANIAAAFSGSGDWAVTRLQRHDKLTEAVRTEHSDVLILNLTSESVHVPVLTEELLRHSELMILVLYRRKNDGLAQILTQQGVHYLPYPQEEEDKLKANEEPAPSKVLSTGDIAPMILKCNENNQCQCPRCGAMMDYVEGQAVHLVDGKPDMENVWDHFHCESCHSVFRRIVNTDFFQFSEK